MRDVQLVAKSSADVNALPEDYWSNTSGNAMVRRFIDKAD